MDLAVNQFSPQFTRPFFCFRKSAGNGHLSQLSVLTKNHSAKCQRPVYCRSPRLKYLTAFDIADRIHCRLDKGNNIVAASVAGLPCEERLEESIPFRYGGIYVINSTDLKELADFTTRQSRRCIANDVTYFLQYLILEFRNYGHISSSSNLL